jgi:hypothetical protein
MTPERDGITGMAAVVAVPPAVYSATPTPTTVDTLGNGKASFLIDVGVGGITFTGTNRVDFIMTHGSLANLSDQAAVAQTDVIISDALTPATITSGIVRSLIVAHSAADVQRVGYVGGKRYVVLTPTFGGTHATGTPMDVICVLQKQDFSGQG